MKKIIITLSLFLAALAVQANGVREDVEYRSQKARASYAFGMTVGGDLKQAGLEIDYAAFTDGLRSAMEDGLTIMDRDDALEIVQNAFESAMLKQSVELQAKEALFLTENALQPEVTQTESGLQYTVLQEGSGPKPKETDTVRVHYEGALVSGVIFDSSYERGEPEEFPLDMVIPGWAEGIMLMNTGSIYRIFLPSSLAYGEHGAGQIIPPYSTLIFTVELLDIVEPSEDDE
jgi:FKBP-type peptidyl-prolyl cis-trans isomerase